MMIHLTPSEQQTVLTRMPPTLRKFFTERGMVHKLPVSVQRVLLGEELELKLGNDVDVSLKDDDNFMSNHPYMNSDSVLGQFVVQRTIFSLKRRFSERILQGKTLRLGVVLAIMYAVGRYRGKRLTLKEFLVVISTMAFTDQSWKYLKSASDE